MHKNESGSLSYTTHKNQLKIYERLKLRPKIVKTPTKTQEEIFITFVVVMICEYNTLKAQATTKTKMCGYVKLKCLQKKANQIKENNQRNQK